MAARGVIDLRRHCGRGAAALFCESACYLPRAQRVLVESVFRDGHSMLQIARLHAHAEHGAGAGPPDAVRVTARRLARSLKTIVRRITSPLFVFVSSRLERAAELGDCDAWPPERRRIGEMVVLHGVPVQHAAGVLGVSIHRVRAHLHAIEAMHQGAGL